MSFSHSHQDSFSTLMTTAEKEWGAFITLRDKLFANEINVTAEFEKHVSELSTKNTLSDFEKLMFGLLCELNNNLSLAQTYYSEASSQYPVAFYCHGKIAEKNKSVEAATTYYQLARGQGINLASEALGLLYLSENEIVKGRQLLEEAAKYQASANFYLGGNMTEDYIEASSYMAKALMLDATLIAPFLEEYIDHSADFINKFLKVKDKPAGLFALSAKYLIKNENFAGIVSLAAAAEAGYAKAYTSLGMIYLEGKHDADLNLQKSFEYFNKGLALGDQDANFGLGMHKMSLSANLAVQAQSIQHFENVANDDSSVYQSQACRMLGSIYAKDMTQASQARSFDYNQRSIAIDVAHGVHSVTDAKKIDHFSKIDSLAMLDAAYQLNDKKLQAAFMAKFEKPANRVNLDKYECFAKALQDPQQAKTMYKEVLKHNDPLLNIMALEKLIEISDDNIDDMNLYCNALYEATSETPYKRQNFIKKLENIVMSSSYGGLSVTTANLLWNHYQGDVKKSKLTLNDRLDYFINLAIRKYNFPVAKEEISQKQLIEMGEQLQKKKNYISADCCYKKCTALYPTDTEAWLKLGNLYALGLGVKQNNAQAIECYQEALKHGAREACVNISVIYQREKNDVLAKKYLEMGVELKVGKANLNLGFLYNDGMGGVIANPEKAFDYYITAYQLGEQESAAKALAGLGYKNIDAIKEYISAMNDEDQLIKLGANFETNKDYLMAIKCWEKFIKINPKHLDILNKLGDIHLQGPSIDRNRARAFDYYMAASKLDSAYAHSKLGDMYLESINYIRAVEYFEKAAKQNVASANHSLGNCYRDGIGVTKDESKAFDYYITAYELGEENLAELGLKSIGYKNIHSIKEFIAAKNDIESLSGLALKVQQNNDQMLAIQCWKRCLEIDGNHIAALDNLGDKYFTGLGVVKNTKLALDYYNKAYELGSPHATSQIGYIYTNLKDYPTALQYLQKAVLLKSGEANIHLGLLYASGQGVMQDIDKAFDYYIAACELNEAQLGMSVLESLGYKNADSIKKYIAAKNNDEMLLALVDSLDVDKEYLLSLKCLEPLVEKNNVDAMIALANLYMVIHPRRDFEKAFYYFSKAQEAASSSQRAEIDVGLGIYYYLKHKNSNRNLSKKHLNAASNAGNLKATANLSALYALENNEIRALDYFEKLCQTDWKYFSVKQLTQGATFTSQAKFLSQLVVAEKNSPKELEKNAKRILAELPINKETQHLRYYVESLDLLCDKDNNVNAIKNLLTRASESADDYLSVKALEKLEKMYDNDHADHIAIIQEKIFDKTQSMPYMQSQLIARIEANMNTPLNSPQSTSSSSSTIELPTSSSSSSSSSSSTTESPKSSTPSRILKLLSKYHENQHKLLLGMNNIEEANAHLQKKYTYLIQLARSGNVPSQKEFLNEYAVNPKTVKDFVPVASNDFNRMIMRKEFNISTIPQESLVMANLNLFVKLNKGDEENIKAVNAYFQKAAEFCVKNSHDARILPLLQELKNNEKNAKSAQTVLDQMPANLALSSFKVPNDFSKQHEKSILGAALVGSPQAIKHLIQYYQHHKKPGKAALFSQLALLFDANMMETEKVALQHQLEPSDSFFASKALNSLKNLLNNVFSNPILSSIGQDAGSIKNTYKINNPLTLVLVMLELYAKQCLPVIKIDKNRADEYNDYIQGKSRLDKVMESISISAGISKADIDKEVKRVFNDIQLPASNPSTITVVESHYLKSDPLPHPVINNNAPRINTNNSPDRFFNEARDKIPQDIKEPVSLLLKKIRPFLHDRDQQMVENDAAEIAKLILNIPLTANPNIQSALNFLLKACEGQPNKVIQPILETLIARDEDWLNQLIDINSDSDDFSLYVNDKRAATPNEQALIDSPDKLTAELNDLPAPPSKKLSSQSSSAALQNFGINARPASEVLKEDEVDSSVTDKKKPLLS